MAKGPVLIVEDRKDWRDILKRMLDAEGFDCAVVPDYPSASSVLKMLKPLALVLDLELGSEDPVWRGWDLAGQARDEGISSVIVTAHFEDRTTRRAYREFGAIDLFDKAYLVDQKQEFIMRVGEAIRITQGRRLSFGSDDLGQIHVTADSGTHSHQMRVVQWVNVEQIDGKHRLSIDSVHFGQAREEFVPPISDAACDLLLQLIGDKKTGWTHLTSKQIQDLQYASFSNGENSDQDLLEQLGIKLYDALAYKKVGVALETAQRDALKQGASFTLRLRIDESAGALVKYPWELIHDRRRFLTQGRISLTRYIACSQATPPLLLSTPLRVLLVTPRPYEITPLPDVEEAGIRAAVREEGAEERFNFERLEPPVSYDRLIKRLRSAKRQGNPYHVVHFDGHGDFGWQCEKCRNINDSSSAVCQSKGCDGVFTRQRIRGHVFFESDSRSKHLVDANQFAVALTGHDVQMVTFSACNTATIEGRSIFNSIGPKLIEEGIPAVIAMQFSISTADTLPFFSGFFGALAASPQIDEAAIEDAVKDARRLITSESWFYPALYLRTQ